MSTFNGIVREFPYIRIDHFRKNPDTPAPLACFLSDVHSDHLQGLESFKAPFLYCSAATRELLLRVEKYPHRLNFSKGILEFRKKHYRHLARLLVEIAETWWVQSLVRNPVLIPYTLGERRLDMIYLDTTFTTKSDTLQTFPSKAEGIRELLEKVDRYPDDTIFYLRNWTFGYEDVWLALSTALNTKIHVDQYQLSLYKSLTARVGHGFGTDDSLYLCGYTLGNSTITGCLTANESARVHSCEPGVMCSKMLTNKSVNITPIVSRTKNGDEIPELGAGGGKGDLEQTHELELPDEATLQKFLALCKNQIQDTETKEKIASALSEAYQSSNSTISLDEYGFKEEEEITLEKLVDMLTQGLQKQEQQILPSSILIEAFRPRDVFPCTVNSSTWNEKVSMRYLFSHLCSGDAFFHDEIMREQMRDFESPRPLKRQRRASDTTSEPVSTQRSTTSEAQSQRIPSIIEINQDAADVCSPPRKKQHVSLDQPEGTQGHHELSDDQRSVSIFDFPESFPTQWSDTQTSLALSPTSRLEAIKQAMQEKFNNQEIDFYLPRLSAEPQPQPKPPEEDTPQSNPGIQTAAETTDGNYDPVVEEGGGTSDDESTISLSSSAFNSSQATFEHTFASIIREKGLLPVSSSQKSSEVVLVPPSAPQSEIEAEEEEAEEAHDRLASRIKAYKAAKRGTFEAWTQSCSIISAGNGHSHKELEL
ncbi:hypothetical protein FQN57_000538 [Myotisia sp. PD_48]|nr:hypothetical protein FQN57_000538 [Myotisia sp. PD_48]